MSLLIVVGQYRQYISFLVYLAAFLIQLGTLYLNFLIYKCLSCYSVSICIRNNVSDWSVLELWINCLLNKWLSIYVNKYIHKFWINCLLQYTIHFLQYTIHLLHYPFITVHYPLFTVHYPFHISLRRASSEIDIKQRKKSVIRNRKSHKDRQCNGQKDNDLQNTTQKN